VTKNQPKIRILGAANIPKLGKFRVQLACGHTLICTHELDSVRASHMACMHGCTKPLPENKD